MPLKFGQGPKIEARVNPPDGYIGTTFEFYGAKFDPNTNVDIQIVDSYGKIVQRFSTTSNRDGNTGNISWMAKSGIAVGQYRAVFTGKSDNKTEKITKSFNVLVK